MGYLNTKDPQELPASPELQRGERGNEMTEAIQPKKSLRAKSGQMTGRSKAISLLFCIARVIPSARDSREIASPILAMT